MDRNRRGALGRLPRAKLEALLRSLTNTRLPIARTMAFALDRPDAAEEVVDVIIQSLLIPSTPVPRKVARLAVVSDILHNCAGGLQVKAWQYRSFFEKRLADVFSHLGEVYKSFPGRMKAEQYRKQITNIVDVWEDWLVFTPTVTQDFRRRLTMGHSGEAAETAVNTGITVEAESDHKVAAESGRRNLEPMRKGAFSAVKTGATEGDHVSGHDVYVNDVDDDEDDLDGEAIDGEAMAIIVEENADLDGEPLAEAGEGEDLDGAPM